MKYIWRELRGLEKAISLFTIFFLFFLFLSECLQELSSICCSHWVSSEAGCQLTSISWSEIYSYLPYGTPSSPLTPKSQLSRNGSLFSPCPGDVRWQILGSMRELQAMNHYLIAKPPKDSHYCFAFRAQAGVLCLLLFPSPVHFWHTAHLRHCKMGICSFEGNESFLYTHLF